MRRCMVSIHGLHFSSHLFFPPYFYLQFTRTYTLHMLAAALPALERANLDADFLEALAELYPTCEAFYFQSCGKLFLAEADRKSVV